MLRYTCTSFISAIEEFVSVLLLDSDGKSSFIIQLTHVPSFVTYSFETRAQCTLLAPIVLENFQIFSILLNNWEHSNTYIGQISSEWIEKEQLLRHTWSPAGCDRHIRL